MALEAQVAVAVEPTVDLLHTTQQMGARLPELACPHIPSLFVESQLTLIKIRLLKSQRRNAEERPCAHDF